MKNQGQEGIDRMEDICYIGIRYRKGGKRNECKAKEKFIGIK